MRNKKKVAITMTPEIQDRGARRAAELGMSLSGLIEQLLRRELDAPAIETPAPTGPVSTRANRKR